MTKSKYVKQNGPKLELSVCIERESIRARKTEYTVYIQYTGASQVAQYENVPANAGDMGLIPGLGRSPGG